MIPEISSGSLHVTFLFNSHSVKTCTIPPSPPNGLLFQGSNFLVIGSLMSQTFAGAYWWSLWVSKLLSLSSAEYRPEYASSLHLSNCSSAPGLSGTEGACYHGSDCLWRLSPGGRARSMIELIQSDAVFIRAIIFINFMCVSSLCVLDVALMWMTLSLFPWAVCTPVWCCWCVV